MGIHRKIYIFLLFFIFIGFSCDEAIELPSPDTTPPIASFLYPLDGDVVKGNYSVKVRAVDNEGVYKVDFYLNQNLVGTDSFPDGDIFKYEWNTLGIDSSTNQLLFAEDAFHYLSFVASDINDNEFASYAIRAVINNEDNENPIATIISPYNNQTISGFFDIEVLAYDNDSIQYVSFYVDNILIGNQNLPQCFDEISPTTGDSITTCYYIWNNVTPGLVGGNGYHSIHAIARDMNNNPSLLSPVSILIDELDDSEPPTGTIINPASGVEVNGVIDIIVQATDNDTVHSVIFYVNGNPEALVYHNPFDPDNAQGNYLFSWNTTSGMEDSENIISATIRDQSFNQTPLSPITIYVNNEPEMDLEPPYLLITSPAAGQTISGETVIRIYATDNDQISRVAFFINDTIRSIDSTGLDNYYEYLWDTNDYTDDIDHNIGAVAFDQTGNNTIASSISVHIDNNDNIYPSGFIQHPSSGQTVSGLVGVSIIAEDDFGVESVNLLINGISVAELNTNPYNYEWDTTIENEDEEHTLAIAITDQSGNTTYNPSISVFVNNSVDEDGIYPTGSIINPISGQTVTGTVAFIVEAHDNISVTEVQFLINGNNVASINTEPFEYGWDTSSFSGSECVLSANVLDNSNNLTQLQPIVVNVE